MSLRLRKPNGDVVQIPPDVTFVEVCDQNGDVGALFIVDPTTNKIMRVGKGDEEAVRYTAIYGVQFVDVKPI